MLILVLTNFLTWGCKIEQEPEKSESNRKAPPQPALQSTVTGLEKVLASPFNLKDTSNNSVTLDRLSRFKQKILAFTNSECDYCKGFFPALNQFNNKYQEQFEVIVLHLGGSIEENKKLLAQNQYSFVLLDADLETFSNYEIDFTPTIFVLDAFNYVEKIGEAENYQELENLALL